MSIPRLASALSVALPLTLAATGASRARTATDEHEVRAALDHYFQGQKSGDVAHYRAAFQPSANLYWIRDGKFAERTSADWIAANGAAPRPSAAAEAPERRQRIAHVDIAGTAAIAKLVTETPDRLVTDYMTLLKTEAGWRIVSKTFSVQPRAGR
jgi:hypothetical protein